MSRLDHNQVARLLHCGPELVRRMMASGEMPGTRRARAWTVAEKDLEKWLRRRCRQNLRRPDRASFRAARRKAALLLRTPAWADWEAIKLIYDRCERLCREGVGRCFHVDHVIPLQGEFVSGLHVSANLQILPATENRRKHNQWQP